VNTTVLSIPAVPAPAVIAATAGAILHALYAAEYEPPAELATSYSDGTA